MVIYFWKKNHNYIVIIILYIQKFILVNKESTRHLARHRSIQRWKSINRDVHHFRAREILYKWTGCHWTARLGLHNIWFTKFVISRFTSCPTTTLTAASHAAGMDGRWRKAVTWYFELRDTVDSLVQVTLRHLKTFASVGTQVSLLQAHNQGGSW